MKYREVHGFDIQSHLLQTYYMTNHQFHNSIYRYNHIYIKNEVHKLFNCILQQMNISPNNLKLIFINNKLYTIDPMPNIALLLYHVKYHIEVIHIQHSNRNPKVSHNNLQYKNNHNNNRHHRGCLIGILQRIPDTSFHSSSSGRTVAHHM